MKTEGAAGKAAWTGLARRPGIIQISMLLLVASSVPAQIMNVGDDTSTPIAGAGHNYRQFLSEMVNPANGSVSVRIQVPVPQDRGVTIPFSFNYDSDGVNHLTMDAGQGFWIMGSGYLNSGGWSYSIPLLTSVFINVKGVQSGGQGSILCPAQNDFVFTDPNGERHSLINLTWFQNAPPSCPLSSTSALDDRYTAQITDVSNGIVKVADRDGTVFTFNQYAPHGPGNSKSSAFTSLPESIEDRNGNVISVTDPGAGGFTFNDASGRQVLSSSGFGTAGNTYDLTVSGLSPYQVSWGSAGSNYGVNFTQISGNDCRGINSEANTQSVITSIKLPNGQQYQFQYDGTYGLLSKVIYPNGAYSRYRWGLNSRAEAVIWPGAGGSYFCNYTYDTPAVQARYVSFDGTNEVLEEDYSYATTWNGLEWSSKATGVTTNVRGVQDGSLQSLGSFKTNYTYLPIEIGQNQYDAPIFPDVAFQLPVENTITYYDFNGQVIKTVTKTWLDEFLQASEVVALNDGSTSKVAYTYNSAAQLAKEVDYDSGAPGTPLKTTVINYQGFAAIPTFPNYEVIQDRPCQVITYDGSGSNRTAETDYLYDNGSTVCGAAGTPSVTDVANLTGHDEANYGTGVTPPRGNVTSKLQQLLEPAKTLTTNYSYDESGQVLSTTDPRGYRTSYSYVDNYVVGSAPSQSNTYLTRVTLPSTFGVNHIQSFSYRYADGQLAASIDQNGQKTSYAYNDSLGRLTGTNYPDGGATSIAYNDQTANPTVTTSKLLSSGSWLRAMTVLDCAGHTIQSQLQTDPSGTDYTDRTYDGLGRLWTVSNPYRSTSEGTYGLTKYVYDALGRPTLVTTADGAATVTSYSGKSSTVTDPAGKSRTSTTDALGRLTQVIESPKASPATTLYGYDSLNNLLSVNQSGRTRTFSYDSLSRLVSATNPETGTICYGLVASGTCQPNYDGMGIC